MHKKNAQKQNELLEFPNYFIYCGGATVLKPKITDIWLGHYDNIPPAIAGTVFQAKHQQLVVRLPNYHYNLLSRSWSMLKILLFPVTCTKCRILNGKPYFEKSISTQNGLECRNCRLIYGSCGWTIFFVCTKYHLFLYQFLHFKLCLINYCEKNG